MINIIYNIFTKIFLLSHFPKVLDVELERRKIGLIRFFIGSIAIVRTLEIIYFYYVLKFNVDIATTLFFFFILISLVFYTIGFLTPIFNLVLYLSYRYFENKTGTFTLGTDMFVNFLLLTLLTNGGVFYSIDNFFLKKENNNIVKSIYKYTHLTNDVNFFNLIYFLFFLYYAFMSFGAILIHAFDPFWYSFLSVKAALVNSYLCKIYFIPRWIDENLPILLGIISFLGVIIQEIFQFFMIPLIFTRIGTFFVKWYGLLFFSLSLFALNLSYLPYVEFGIWFIIFFPLYRNTKEKRVHVIFDDYCNLCKSTMRKFKFLNFNKSIEFVKLSNSSEIVNKYHLDNKLIKSYMVGIYNEKIYIGYDLYILICKLNPLLYFLLPILWFFKYVIPIGPMVYNWIAERRYKLFNQCELDKNDYLNQDYKITVDSVTENIAKMFFSMVIILYFFIYFPYIVSSGLISSKILNDYPFANQIMFFFKNKFYKTISNYGGAVIPNVFNKTDLSMGENYFTYYRIHNNDTILVPITGEYGQRLNYQNFNILLLTNHNSDILYFNTTLNYRRSILKISDQEKIQFHLDPNQDGFKTIKKLIIIDYNYIGASGRKKYLIRFYQNKSASGLKLWEYNPEAYKNVLKLEMEVEFDGKEIQIIGKKIFN